jgi:plasmid stabilization system protein ParE
MERYRLVILPVAQSEIEEIAQVHMALSGPNSARKITNKLYDAMEQLTMYPLSGPPILDALLRAAGYRYILANKYMIFYRFLDSTVVIYHVAHGSTDYPSMLKASQDE